MPKRYALHFQVYEVDEDGDFVGQPLDEVTCDYAIESLDHCKHLINHYFTNTNQYFEYPHHVAPVTPRRPETEEEEQ